MHIPATRPAMVRTPIQGPGAHHASSYLQSTMLTTYYILSRGLEHMEEHLTQHLCKHPGTLVPSDWPRVIAMSAETKTE